jgi:hypothetical protein
VLTNRPATTICLQIRRDRSHVLGELELPALLVELVRLALELDFDVFAHADELFEIASVDDGEKLHAVHAEMIANQP